MFLDPIVSMPTDGNTTLSSLRSGPVLRIIGSNQIQVCSGENDKVFCICTYLNSCKWCSYRVVQLIHRAWTVW